MTGMAKAEKRLSIELHCHHLSHGVRWRTKRWGEAPREKVGTGGEELQLPSFLAHLMSTERIWRCGCSLLGAVWRLGCAQVVLSPGKARLGKMTGGRHEAEEQL